jgi:hypothetical protein
MHRRAREIATAGFAALRGSGGSAFDDTLSVTSFKSRKKR